MGEHAFKLGLHYDAIHTWGRENGYPLTIVNRDHFLWEGAEVTGPAILMDSEETLIAFRMRFF